MCTARFLPDLFHLYSLQPSYQFLILILFAFFASFLTGRVSKSLVRTLSADNPHSEGEGILLLGSKIIVETASKRMSDRLSGTKRKKGLGVWTEKRMRGVQKKEKMAVCERSVLTFSIPPYAYRECSAVCGGVLEAEEIVFRTQRCMVGTEASCRSCM